VSRQFSVWTKTQVTKNIRYVSSTRPSCYHIRDIGSHILPLNLRYTPEVYTECCHMCFTPAKYFEFPRVYILVRRFGVLTAVFHDRVQLGHICFLPCHYRHQKLLKETFINQGLFCGSPKVLFIHTKLQTKHVVKWLRILQRLSSFPQNIIIYSS
jgi:hypothetical protein